MRFNQGPEKKKWSLAWGLEVKPGGLQIVVSVSVDRGAIRGERDSGAQITTGGFWRRREGGEGNRVN